MKEKTNFLAMTLCLCAGLCAASSGGNAGILQFVACAQHVGIGTYVGEGKLAAISAWYGDLGTNSLSIMEWGDEPVFLQKLEPGDKAVYFLSTRQWNPVPSNIVFRGQPPSAWEYREKLISAGVSPQPCPKSSLWGGIRWVGVGTNDTQVLNYVSNVVHSLCVSRDLIQYSQALIPAIEVEADSPLFLFKGEAMLEMLALEWSESEAFLEYVLNAPAYPRRVRGSALYQLKQRFGWPATNTVPEL